MSDPICSHIIGYLDSDIGEILLRQHSMLDIEGEFVAFNFCPLCGDVVLDED